MTCNMAISDNNIDLKDSTQLRKYIIIYNKIYNRLGEDRTCNQRLKLRATFS